MQQYIVYQCIHKRLVEKFGREGFIDRQKIFITISRLYHIEKRFMPYIFKELKHMKIIEESDDRFRKKLKVTPINSSPEDLIYATI